ncbi:MAG: cation:proton antiporter [Candidatus Methanomethylicia archaeon]|nr:cation:proton antiporter [Candidatus Methanomethylicia archaeon]
MVDLYAVALVSTAIAIAAILSVRFSISSAIFEVAAGIVLGNFLGVTIDGWLDFLGTFGGLMLTFLAGAEIETRLMKKNLKVSLVVGTMSFLAPLIGEFFFFMIFTNWNITTIMIASLALTTTSVAVVYAVLTEYDLLKLQLGGLIISITFVNDILTLIGVNLLSPSLNYFTILFIGLIVSMALILPRLLKKVIASYGRRSVEIELRIILALILLMALVADAGKLHAVFGVFLFGFLFANSIQKYDEIRSKIRTVTFAILSPAFFIKAGLLIDLQIVINSWTLIIGALAAKLISKIIGTYPLTRKWIPEGAAFSTLMLSTGLTVGTITATLGFELGFLTKDQFTLVVLGVIMSAIVPTLIAKRFMPRKL